MPWVFFSKLLGEPEPDFASQIKIDCFNAYLFVGASRRDACQMVRVEVEQSKKEARLASPFGEPENYWASQADKPAGIYGAAWPPGTFAAPSLYGKSLLFRESSIPSVKRYLDTIRSEAVTDEDVLWFWDMDSTERIMMMRLFRLCVGGQWISVCRQTASPEQAAHFVSKVHPAYGNPDAYPGRPGRLLPVELLNRLNIYSYKRRTKDFTGFENDIARFVSFNALIRRAIQEGEF